MIRIWTGTDTYGRVKAVGGTSIVTKFAMFQFLPVFPLQSFYISGPTPPETRGIPFLLSWQSVAVDGIPLVRLDRTSVLIAYARAVFATFTLFGSLALILGILSLNEGRVDEFTRIAMGVLLGALAVGVVGGGLTYASPWTSRRDRDIRRYCAERLGMAVDPARVPPEFGRSWAAADVEDAQPWAHPRDHMIDQLIAMRTTLARSMPRVSIEAKTDELLDRLRGFDQFTA